MQREILAIRHGEAYNSVAPDGRRLVADPANPPLTPLGEAQAAAAAERTAAFAPDLVVTSPFLRTCQTAFAHLQRAGGAATADVRMSEHFVFEPLAHFRGVDREDYAARFGDRVAIAPALAGPEPYPHFPESEAEVETRVQDLLDHLLAREDWACAAFYGHWATLAPLARLLDPGAVFIPEHTSITHLVEDSPGSWRAVLLGDASHLAGLVAD